MNTLRAIAALSGLASVSLLASAQEMAPSEVFAKASGSVVVILGHDLRGRSIEQGSGVVIKHGLVVTNCHVIRGAFGATVRTGAKELEASLVHMDAVRDVCSLDVPRLAAEPVHMSHTTARIGQRVYAIGAPRGLELTLSEGLVSNIREKYLQTTAPISPGSSGGGLFDGQARLVGLTTLYLKDSQQLNFAIPTEWIDDLPKRHNEPDAQAAAVEYGRLALNNIETVLKASDPDWACKRSSLIPIVTERVRQLHPMEWASALMSEYNELSVDTCVAERPERSDGRLRYAQTLTEAALWRALATYATAWTRQEPQSANAWFYLAVAYHALGKPEESVDAYERLATIDAGAAQRFLKFAVDLDIAGL